MERTPVKRPQLTTDAKGLARRLVTIGENRLQLLMVEVQEEREQLLRAVYLTLAIAVFGLLAGLTLTAAIVVWLWEHSPLTVLLSLTGLYGLVGTLLYWRLNALSRDWKPFSATLDQIEKDGACLEAFLE